MATGLKYQPLLNHWDQSQERNFREHIFALKVIGTNVSLMSGNLLHPLEKQSPILCDMNLKGVHNEARESGVCILALPTSEHAPSWPVAVLPRLSCKHAAFLPMFKEAQITGL